jgi:hypothetical protein
MGLSWEGRTLTHLEGAICSRTEADEVLGFGHFGTGWGKWGLLDEMGYEDRIKSDMMWRTKER